MEQLSLYRLVWLYLRLGNLTFGGGDPTMAAMHSELVVARRWLPPDKYALAYALARITPGTNILAFCAGTAWQLFGWPAAVLCVLAASVPAAIVVFFLTAGYDALKSNTLAMAAIGGTLAAAVGMMATAAWQLARPYVTRKRWLHVVVITGASIALSLYSAVPPIYVLGLAALAGVFWRVPE